MYDDLISRNALISNLRLFLDRSFLGEINAHSYISVGEIAGLIKDTPTVYDIDKVIERLQTELTLADEEKKRCIKENSLQFDVAKGYAQGIVVAIEIVKSGIGSKYEK